MKLKKKNLLDPGIYSEARDRVSSRFHVPTGRFQVPKNEEPVPKDRLQVEPVSNLEQLTPSDHISDHEIRL